MALTAKFNRPSITRHQDVYANSKCVDLARQIALIN
jgi:hypothetical protein